MSIAQDIERSSPLRERSELKNLAGRDLGLFGGTVLTAHHDVGRVAEPVLEEAWAKPR